VKGIDKLFLLNAVVADELTEALITYGIARRAGVKHGKEMFYTGHDFDAGKIR
jgi:hypothetical protein